MQKDIRESAAFQKARFLTETLRKPGTGLISDAAEVHVSQDGRHAVFAGTFVDRLEGEGQTRICQVDVHSGDMRVLTFGPHTDRSPKYSPDGRRIAFLSDRQQPGNFQLYLLEPSTGAATLAVAVLGWVEYFHWSPDGLRILLGVAGHGADISGGQGAITSKRVAEDLPAWMPAIDAELESFHWRRVHVYVCATGQIRQVSDASSNVWEAVWCGNDALAAVMSPGPKEGLWYSARLFTIDIENGATREVLVPQDQLGCPAASPSGRHLAVVEAFCSDRWIVAGELRLIQTRSGGVQRVDTRGVDITYAEWRSERALLLAGHRGFETIVALYDVACRTFAELWSSDEISGTGRFITISGFNEQGDCVLIGEGFLRAPEIAVIQNGHYCTVRSFDVGFSDHAKHVAAIKQLRWQAPDGLEIQGWLLCPEGKAPFPLIMNIHGGPVWHWHPGWIGRGSGIMLLLIKQGYAIFLPNPRGSTARGQGFAREVRGEMGGADTYDLLSGLDHLVDSGLADVRRLGVTGGSYGGFMSSWLITQDSRFAASVPVALVSNHVTEHLISNIPHFVALFVGGAYNNPESHYFERSPIMHAHKVDTPTLSICGALDRCTPPEEAVQFHNALLDSGVKSVLVTYPQEGHGIRHWPALLDYAARVAGWFEEHMPAGQSSS